MNKLITKIVGAALGLTMTVGVGVALGVNAKSNIVPAEAAEVSVAVATFNATNNKSSISSYTDTWQNVTDGFSWTLVNFNNNKTCSSEATPGTWSYVKCGRKNNASVANISTTNTVSAVITKAAITVDALTASKINSITLYGGASGTTSIGTFTVGQGTKTLSIPAAKQAANQKYKIEFNCASGSSNGLLTLSKVELFTESSDVYPTSISCATQNINVIDKVDLSTQVSFTNSGGQTVTVKNLSYAIASGSNFIDLDTSSGIVTGKKGGTASVTITAETNNSGGTTSCTASIVVSSIPASGLTIGSQYAIYAIDSDNSFEGELSGVTSNLGTVNEIFNETPSFTNCWTVGVGYFENTVTFKKGTQYLSLTAESNNLFLVDSVDENSSWKVVWNSSTYAATVSNCVYTNRSIQFNYNSGNSRFACYGSNQVGICLREYESVQDPTTLTMDVSSISVGEGETTSSALTFTTDSPNAYFRWYSEDETKATVSNGFVTGTASSGIVKVYVWFDTDGSGDFDPAEDLNDYCTVTLTEPSIDYSSKTYGGVGTLITSLSGLSAGDKIAITNVDDDALAGTTIVSDTIRLSSATFSISGSELIIGDGSEEIDALILSVDTYNSSTGAITLKHGDKWLSSSAAKKANFANEAFTWTLSFSSSIPVLTSSISGGGTLQYNYNGGTNPRFIPYASEQTAIHLWNVETYSDAAENYANSFLNSGVCGSNDNTKADSTIWGQQRTAYLALSDGAQYLLSHATANAGSTDDIQKCLAKYDRVIYLHYSAEPTSYPDFMNRVANNFVTPLANGVSSFLTNNNDAATATVIVIVMFSATALGTFFFLRRRKERN